MRTPLCLLSSLVVIALALAGCAQPADDAETGVTVSGSIDPDPPVVGDHQLTLTIKDKDGAGLEGLKLEVTPWMPAHDHGSSEDPELSESSGGEYVVDKVNFMMPGDWEVRVVFEYDGESVSETLDYVVTGDDDMGDMDM